MPVLSLSNDAEGNNEDYPFCHCKEDIEEAEMVKCGNANCTGQWFHFSCVGIVQADIDALGDDDWFRCDECRQMEVFQYCCGVDLGSGMVGCDNPKCPKQWYHLECVGLSEENIPEGKWFCSTKCRSGARRRPVSKGTKDVDDEDYLQRYCLALLWRELNDRIRHMAVRKGNGDKMMLYWKIDMIDFFIRNHVKYFLLGHMLLAGINGWLPERLREDIKWNRTVNYRGGKDKNLEMDLVNEYLNKEFITDLKQKTNLTEQTVARHGAMVGNVKNGLRKIFAEVAGESGLIGNVGGKPDTHNVVLEMVKVYDKDKIFDYVKGRKGRGFPRFNYKYAIDDAKFANRVKNLSKKLDRRRKLIVPRR